MNENKYTKMQKAAYRRGVYQASVDAAMKGVVPTGDHFTPLNEMDDMHEYLFRGVPKGGVALDFGCGPGRAIVRYRGLFDRIDGVDISEQNIIKVKEYVEWAGLPTPNFWVNNGVDLQVCPSFAYDVVFSIQVMPHIGVYDIRRNLLEEMYRVLKPSGWVCIQMGYGGEATSRMAKYYENLWDAPQTNGKWGVTVLDPREPQRDLEEIGFKNFSYDIRDLHKFDNSRHPQFIYFRGQK